MQQNVAFESYNEQTSLLFEEREQGIKEIEESIIEVNGIYKDLSALVNEQGETLDHIETNMTYAEDSVADAVVELGKANHYAKKSRCKMLCVLLFALVIVLIIIIVPITLYEKKKT